MAKKFHIVGLGRSGTHLMKNIIDNLYEQLSIETKITQTHWAEMKRSVPKKPGKTLNLMCIRDIRDVIASSIFKILGHTSESNILEKISNKTYFEYLKNIHRGSKKEFKLIDMDERRFYQALQHDPRLVLTSRHYKNLHDEQFQKPGKEKLTLIPYSILYQFDHIRHKSLSINEQKDIDKHIKFYNNQIGISELVIRKYTERHVNQGYGYWINIVKYFFNYENYMKNPKKEIYRFIDFQKIKRDDIDINRLINCVNAYKLKQKNMIGANQGKSSKNLLFNEYQLNIINNISKIYMKDNNYE